MKKHNCKTLVFSSTAAIYKKSENYLITEDAEIQPTNPYGITKYNMN